MADVPVAFPRLVFPEAGSASGFERHALVDAMLETVVAPAEY